MELGDPALSGQRHRGWERVAPHKYICVACGTFAINVQGERGAWRKVFDKPDGYIVDQDGGRTPPCERGERTQQRLDYWEIGLGHLERGELAAAKA